MADVRSHANSSDIFQRLNFTRVYGIIAVINEELNDNVIREVALIETTELQIAQCKIKNQKGSELDEIIFELLRCWIILRI